MVSKLYFCVVFTYTVEYYSVIKNNEIMLFIATWMDLEIIILKEVNQKEVSVEEYLSDQIYYYQTAMHRLAGVEVCSTTEGES